MAKQPTVNYIFKVKEELITKSEFKDFSYDKNLEYDNYLQSKGVTVLVNGYLWAGTNYRKYYPSIKKLNEDYSTTLLVGKFVDGFYTAIQLYESRNINSLDDWVTFMRENEGKLLKTYPEETKEAEKISVDQLLNEILEHKREKKVTMDDINYYNEEIKKYNEGKDEKSQLPLFESVEAYLDKINAEYGVNNLLKYKQLGDKKWILPEDETAPYMMTYALFK